MIEIEQEQKEVEFTIEELNIIMRGLCNETAIVLFPPADKETFSIICSAQAKIHYLIDKQKDNDRQYQDNARDRE